MAFSTKLRFFKQKMEQLSGDTITLSGDTIIDYESGNIKYNNANASISEDAQLTTKKYVDDNAASGISANTIYNLASPSTATDIFGVPAGTTLTGNNSNELLEMILVPYMNPAYTSFSISTQSTIIEVGNTLSGNKTFIWNISQPANVSANTVSIIDVTDSNAVLDSGLANNGSEIVDIGTIINTTPITQAWKSTAFNTEGTLITSNNFTVNSIYPYYWGKVNAPGAAGTNRPTATNELVTGGTKVVGVSTDTITVDFNSGDDDYIWFAIPSTSTDKTKWYVTEDNKGSISGSVTPGGNKFPDFDTVSITSAEGNWNGINYKVYISNYQGADPDPMQLRNS